MKESRNDFFRKGRGRPLNRRAEDKKAQKLTVQKHFTSNHKQMYDCS